MSDSTPFRPDHAAQKRAATTLAILVAPSRHEALHELTGTGTVAATGAALPFALGLHVVDFQLANLQRAGIRDVIVVQPEDAGRPLQDYLRQAWQPAFTHLACLAGSVEAEFGDFGLPVLRRCLALITALAPDNVLLMPADQICDPDLADMLNTHQSRDALLTLEVHDGDCPSARLDDWLPGLSVGPSALSGALIFNARWLQERLTSDPASEATLLHHLLRHGLAPDRIQVWTDSTTRRYWRSLDSLDAFRVTWLDFVSSDVMPCRLPGDRTEMSRGASAMANTPDTVVMPGASVGAQAFVSRAIVAPGAHVPDGWVIGQDAGFDAHHFRRTPGGTVLITDEMLTHRASSPAFSPFKPQV